MKQNGAIAALERDKSIEETQLKRLDEYDIAGLPNDVIGHIDNIRDRRKQIIKEYEKALTEYKNKISDQ